MTCIDKLISLSLSKGCTEAFGSLYELQASGFDPTKLVGESKGDTEGWSEYTLPVKDSTEFDNDAVTLKAAPSVMTLDEVFTKLIWLIEFLVHSWHVL